MIDLTRKIESGMSVYPGDPFFQSHPVADHNEDGYRVTRLTFGSHLGTHLDAPFHFFEDGETLDSFPLDFFWASAAAIDLTPFIADSAESPRQITPEILSGFAPVFESVEAVLLKTGWESRWGKGGFYEDFPSLTQDAAEWIAEYPIRILGTETPSLSALDVYSAADEGDELGGADESGEIQDEDKNGEAGRAFQENLHADAECHRILLGRVPPVLLLEGLVSLNALDAIRSGDDKDLSKKLFRLACFPLPIEKSDGCPVRAVAFSQDDLKGA